jgi:hypothetical protein
VTRRELYIVAAGVVVAVLAFVGGRYSLPAKVVERVKVETKVETVTEWKDRIVEKRVDGPVRIRTVVTEVPGPSPACPVLRQTETVEDRGPVVTDTIADASGGSTVNASTVATSTKITENERPGWRLAAAALWDPRALAYQPDRYQLEVDRRIIGTVWLGARATTDLRFGLALGVEF